MGNKINDPIARLMGLRYKSHPWHGLEVGDDAPEVVTAFIEMVPTDTVKYELDKVSGYIKIDRPQKYSNGYRLSMALFRKVIAVVWSPNMRCSKRSGQIFRATVTPWIFVY